MQSLNDNERKQVLGEVLSGELKVIREYVQDVPLLKQDIKEIKNDVRELKSDMKVVKVAITDMSKQLVNHERRITRLELA